MKDNEIDNMMLKRTGKLFLVTEFWYLIATLLVNHLGWDEDKTYCMVVGYMFLSMCNNIVYMLYRKIKG